MVGLDRVTDDNHDGIVEDLGDDHHLRTGALTVTNDLPCDVTGYWSLIFANAVKDYGATARAYWEVGGQWREIITDQEFMATIPAGQTLSVPLLLEGIFPVDINLGAFSRW